MNTNINDMMLLTYKQRQAVAATIVLWLARLNGYNVDVNNRRIHIAKPYHDQKYYFPE